jgi:putative hemolysin
MEHLASKWSKRAKVVLRLLENPENFLSSVQVGITLIGIISGAYGGSAIAATLAKYFEVIPFIWIHAEWIALVTAIWVITYFSIVIGELVPKTIAMNNPEWLALFCVPVLRYFMFLTYPFVRLLSFSTNIILRVLRMKEIAEDRLSEEELIVLLKNAWKQWILDKDESKIHHNVFSFWEQTAKSILTHRNEIEWIDIASSTDNIFETIQSSVHSKFVVANGSLDKIVGILYLKDFLENQNSKDFVLENIIIKPIIITERTSAIQVLNTFKKKKQYIAVVVDEFGWTEGIITLHDLMEVIVWDLPDEDEEIEGNIIRRNENEYFINGKTLIYEINQFFQEDVIKDNSNEYTTISGYIMNRLGRLPKTAEKIQSQNNYEIEIVDLDGVRIDKVLLRKVREKVV